MSSDALEGRHRGLLLASVFTVAIAGLVYELIAGTLSTYLLGSSVTVFSLVIGLFLSAMGLGAWLAQHVHSQLIRTFVLVEIWLALCGGLSALVLFASYPIVGSLYPVVAAIICVVVGTLVGIEIPILLRILEREVQVRVAVSQVLSLDYAGSLIASIIFPLWMLPQLGVVRSAALLGLLNLSVALIALYEFADRIKKRRALWLHAGAVGAILGAVFLTSAWTTSRIEDKLYADAILLTQQTPYQRVVLTRWRDDLRLYLNGHLQFSTHDEYRYHESLVHPAMSAAGQPQRVLIIGGGDGLAVREVLRYDSVQHIDLVDLDPAITQLAQHDPLLREVNEHALDDPKVRVFHQDALSFLEERTDHWDVIIMDLPDPNDDGMARLYSQPAFRLVGAHLAEGGALVTQSTSPFFAPEAFWCIVATATDAFKALGRSEEARPYHVNVPSFGEWGFTLLSSRAPTAPTIPTRFLDEATLRGLFHFPKDLIALDVEVNHLDRPVLPAYYRMGWERYNDS